MEKSKLLSVLGLARRAGRLSMGHDAALGAVAEKKAGLLLFACDSSQRLRREFEVFIEKRKMSIPVFTVDITIEEIYSSCSGKAAVIAVNDENFCKKIISLLDNHA